LFAARDARRWFKVGIKSKGTRVLFLDVDGVLVNAQSWDKATANHNIRELEAADPPCVAALNRIIAATGARIVVSSCWRIGRSLPELRELLHSWKVEAPVIGKTPNIGGSRGEEIAAWIREYEKSRDIASIVILDDDSDMDELTKFHVKTGFELGLTEADAELAIQILGGQ
jgi:hypothetical protein